jgi:hypothetical protein
VEALPPGRKFVLMTDHCGLRYQFDQLKLNARQARWMALLSEFDFEIKHIKGKENRVVDALSRSMKTIHLVAMSTCKTDVKERVRNAQETDPFFQTMTSYLEQEPTGIKYEGTTYHPQIDGQTERVNQILEDMLRMHVMHQPKKWEDYLPLVEFAYNNGYQESLKTSPFEVLYGRLCNTPISWSNPINRVTIGLDMLK